MQLKGWGKTFFVLIKNGAIREKGIKVTSKVDFRAFNH
jgi:hypothetical protein